MSELPPPGRKRWLVGAVDSDSARRLGAEASISPLLARLLVSRGIRTGDEARRFLEPTFSDLHDPFLMKGMREAVDRVLAARERKERVLVYGDYDVDGLTAVAQLRAAFRRVGIDAEAFIPHRLRDGYGLRPETAARILEMAPGLVVTVDCGISAVEGIRRLVEAGTDVVVTDHHLPPERLPAGAVIVNPKQPGCDYPYRELSGSGLAFKLVQALAMRGEPVGELSSYARIAALGTVADMVPLDGENRVLSRLGALGLAGVRAPGLRALFEKVGILGRVPDSYDIGFRIGPRLNAAGRIDVAGLALELLETRDPVRARAIVEELERLNSERKSEEKRVVAEARERLLADDRDPVSRGAFVLAAEGWHRGVLGIAASRIVREFHRPSLLLAIEGERASGSGRSIPAISLHGSLDPHRELFREFGGHHAAVGLTLDASRLAELETRFEETILSRHLPDDFVPVVEAELEAEVAELGGEGILEELARLEPTGAGNRKPRFLVRGLRTSRVRRVGSDGGSLVGRFADPDRREISFAFWDPSEEERRAIEEPARAGIDVIAAIGPNPYDGGRPQLTVEAARESGSGPR
jgi:single-stranded-DNA-specific exonuclease